MIWKCNLLDNNDLFFYIIIIPILHVGMTYIYIIGSKTLTFTEQDLFSNQITQILLRLRLTLMKSGPF